MPRRPQRLNHRKLGLRRSAKEIRSARKQGARQPRGQLPAPPARPSQEQTARTFSFRSRRALLIAVPLAIFVMAGVFLLPTFLKTFHMAQKVLAPPPPGVKVVKNAQGSWDLIPNPDGQGDLPDWGKNERVNILLLGVDETPERLAQGESPRSDTMIVVTIDPATKKVGMLSIPRDLLVTIPGVGETKINAAYANGATSKITTGPGLVIATIEHNFHIPIHYFAEVNFEGFIKIIDTIGGVTIDVPAPVKDDKYPGEEFNYTRLYFHSGLQHMDGRTALQYARSRYGDNDFGRSARQQQVLQTLRAQAIQLGLIKDAPELIEELGSTVRTDLRPQDLLSLAKLASGIKDANVHSYSLEGAVTDYWSPNNGPYYLIPDWESIRSIVEQMMPGSLTTNQAEANSEFP